MSDEVAEYETNKDPLMMKAVKAFKANYVSPIQLRFVSIMYTVFDLVSIYTISFHVAKVCFTFTYFSQSGQCAKTLD